MQKFSEKSAVLSGRIGDAERERRKRRNRNAFQFRMVKTGQLRHYGEGKARCRHGVENLQIVTKDDLIGIVFCDDFSLYGKEIRRAGRRPADGHMSGAAQLMYSKLFSFARG